MIINFINRFFEFADYYKLDLDEIHLFRNKNKFKKFEFILAPKEMYSKIIDFNYSRGEAYVKIVKDRLSSSIDSCFIVIDRKKNKIAYTRWLRIDTFYSSVLNEHLKFNDNEALTYDSYTSIEYRGQGLHKQMNIEMLYYIKNNTKIKKVYIIIKWFYPYLHKIVKNIGYKKIKTEFYYKRGSFVQFLKILYRKLI